MHNQRTVTLNFDALHSPKCTNTDLQVAQGLQQLVAEHSHVASQHGRLKEDERIMHEHAEECKMLRQKLRALGVEEGGAAAVGGAVGAGSRGTTQGEQGRARKVARK